MSHHSITLPGSTECIHEARTWVRDTLGENQGVDDAVLVASELATNAIRHSASGRPGGTFTLHVAAFTDRWHVRVDDAGGLSVPRIQTVDDDHDEAGRGLAMVASLSLRWGVFGDYRARGVWAEVPIPDSVSPDDESEAYFPLLNYLESRCP
ncbi:ATP-binding protein [Catenulispora sp. NL8]|uniref:ATP-binding protein n=1 Tax=Catenulispora pinistramenti TaxID=2705254 RepID=A0ABS5KHH1_9ACTN|nr:ATP-binding protein [Catenulispora pinistramenti]MBS2545315.1 ATP-binding protein [Catenulispora pinistramenti]